MNWMKEIIEMLPKKMIIGILINWLKIEAKKTDNEWDDMGVAIAEKILNNIGLLEK